MKKMAIAAALALASMGAMAQQATDNAASAETAKAAQRLDFTPPLSAADAGQAWAGVYTQLELSPAQGESAKDLWAAASKAIGAQNFSEGVDAWIGQAPTQPGDAMAQAISQVARVSGFREETQMGSTARAMAFATTRETGYLVSVSCAAQKTDAPVDDDCARRMQAAKSRSEESFLVRAHFIGKGAAIVDWSRHAEEGNALEKSVRDNVMTAQIGANRSLVFAEAHGAALRVSIFTPTLVAEPTPAQMQSALK